MSKLYKRINNNMSDQDLLLQDTIQLEDITTYDNDAALLVDVEDRFLNESLQSQSASSRTKSHSIPFKSNGEAESSNTQRNKESVQDNNDGNEDLCYEDIEEDESDNRNLIFFDTSKYNPPGSRLQGQKLLYFTSLFVSLGVFVFGYDQGVCSGIITFPMFVRYFKHPTSSQIGLVVSILEIGAMISSLLVGKLSDLIGRKKIIIVGSIIFVVGGLCQTFCNGLLWLGIGRVISGLGVGLLSTIIPIYQSEISPSHERGRFACIEFTGNILGYSTSVWIDYFCWFLKGDIGWRLPLFIQCVLGTILMLGSFFIVESPRWLLDHDFDEEGYEVLNYFYHGNKTPNCTEKEFSLIKKSILNERRIAPLHERSYKQIFTRYRRRLLLSISALMFAQLNGINIISYYAPLVFEEAGFKNENALLVTGINSLIYLGSTIPPWFLVDRWGRKPILIFGGLIMCCCLLLISLMMWLEMKLTSVFVAILVIIYNASFGFSWGPVAWLLPPEYLPLSVRSLGCSISTGIGNWFFNYLVGQMTPILQDSWGWSFYLLPASSCCISLFVVYFGYPETKGIELEDMDALFENADSVKSYRVLHSVNDNNETNEWA